ncbi:MAG: cobalamin biosynthesis protein [Coriobacteriales bacterium]|nr:cobalamin biosynthesis protein [Coriobacteriales bacterium]
MRVHAIAFSAKGCELACSLADALGRAGDAVRVFGLGAHVAASHVEPCDSLRAWAERGFTQADALLFVGACGIAVRAIAPFVRDKLRDPAVVCVDEAATFAVPLLSGHVGGANELARRVARACGAQAVVTTATDVSGVFSFDDWAMRQNLAVLDREEAKEVSATLLDGGRVGFACDVVCVGELPVGVVGGEAATSCAVGVCVSLDERRRPFARTLRLAPRVVVVGVGCRRGTAASSIAHLVDACLDETHVAPQTVCGLATIDVKADEPGLLEFAQRRGWELRCHSAEELAAVPGEFCSSEFVRRAVGVDNVCERASCATGGRLLLGKRSASGVTVALAAREPRVSFAEGEVEP